MRFASGISPLLSRGGPSPLYRCRWGFANARVKIFGFGLERTAVIGSNITSGSRSLSSTSTSSSQSIKTSNKFKAKSQLSKHPKKTEASALIFPPTLSPSLEESPIGVIRKSSRQSGRKSGPRDELGGEMSLFERDVAPHTHGAGTSAKDVGIQDHDPMGLLPPLNEFKSQSHNDARLAGQRGSIMDRIAELTRKKREKLERRKDGIQSDVVGWKNARDGGQTTGDGVADQKLEERTVNRYYPFRDPAARKSD